MKVGPEEEKDKETREAMDYAAERVARLLWDHWMWLQEEKKKKSKKKDS